MLALLSLGLLLQEDITYLLKPEEDPTTATPYIVMSGDDPIECSDYTIYVDGVVVCKTSSFLKSFKLVFASFYIFHVAYPKEIMNLLTFVQKIILNMSDKTAKRAKVMSLLSKLVAK
jgi:hypothetical protein